MEATKFPTTYIISPPPQPNNTTQNNVLPKQPQLPTQPSPNPNNKEVQFVHNNDTTYQTYSVELQEINLRSGKKMQQQPKLIENEETEK